MRKTLILKGTLQYLVYAPGFRIRKYLQSPRLYTISSCLSLGLLFFFMSTSCLLMEEIGFIVPSSLGGVRYIHIRCRCRARFGPPASDVPCNL